MKRRFSKILGVGLTLALLTSLLLTAAPVAAADVSDITVTLSDYSISRAVDYTIKFKTNDDIDTTVPESVTIVFPTGTDASGLDAVDVLKVRCSAGTWTGNYQMWVVVDVGNITVVDEVTATIELDDLSGTIGEGAWIELTTAEVVITGPVTKPARPVIVNPATTGGKTLTVHTSVDDTKVTSPIYTLTVPDIEVLPGIVQQYNSTGILMAQETGDDAINAMVNLAQDNYTVIVGPGEYLLDDSGANTTIVLGKEGVTLNSSAGAEDTIIVVDMSKDAIQITADKVTVDGFTIEDTLQGYAAIRVTGDDATVINNIMTDTEELGYPEGIRIELNADGATVSGNELDLYHTMMVVDATGTTLSDNIFGAGINLDGVVTDITITGNTLIGVELWGIVLWQSHTYTDVLIEGNTISETVDSPAAGIYIKGDAVIDNLQITGNDITDNEGVGILIDSDVTIDADSAIAVKFNTITGNDADSDGYGIQNDATADATDVDATLNWWGTSVADDVAAMVNDASEGDTTYEPFLAGTAEAVFSATDVAVGATSLDAKDTVGVRVEDATGANVIVASKYIANPQAAIADAIAFYDVYVAGADPDVTPTIKFYAGDANSKLYVWSADTEAWADLSEEESFGFSVYGGYIYVDYAAELLGGTPFAVVAGTVAEPGTPKIVTPTTGDDTVSLTPIFAWEAVPDVAGYYFEFADNANFVLPLVSLTGDLGRLIVTAYAYVEELPYSTPYYWRVKAVSGTVEAGDLAESAWASGVFITMDEPEEPTPPIVIEPYEPPVITIEQPDIIVPLPAETAITPAWIYVIIAVGAVLVIALLVLIVRTRRVA